MNEQQLLLEFVRWLLTSAGAGVAVFATIEEIDRLWPQNRPALSSEAKFYLAWVLSFVYPVIAYVASLAILGLPWTWAGVFAAIAAGYAASQRIHRTAEQRERLERAEEQTA